jgi:hypothetical protein
VVQRQEFLALLILGQVDPVEHLHLFAREAGALAQLLCISTIQLIRRLSQLEVQEQLEQQELPATLVVQVDPEFVLFMNTVKGSVNGTVTSKYFRAINLN